MDVLAFIFQAVTQADGSIYFHMLTEPSLMTVKECIQMANEVNNNADLPQVMMCMPPIVEPGVGI